MTRLDNLRRQAKRWLRSLRAGDSTARERLRRAHPAAPAEPGLRDMQHALARELGEKDWIALKTSASDNPSSTLQRYEQLARDLVTAFESGAAPAMQQLTTHFGRTFTWQELRANVTERLRAVAIIDVSGGGFGLAHARLLIARQAKFGDWNDLVGVLMAQPSSVGRTPITQCAPVIEPGMIVPAEVVAALPVRMRDGTRTTTREIWDLLTACREGDLTSAMNLLAACPALLLCDYNYMTPLHLAVRQGHVDLVRILADRGAANPNYVTYPYRESLIVLARDRGYETIAAVLKERYAAEDHGRPEEEGGTIEDGRDEERVRFQRLVNHDALPEVEAMLRDRSELALDPFASWFEGILAMPSNRGNRPMLELLMEYGARVPDVTKWGASYYFKRDEIAAWLLERGMNPRHMNIHDTTLLHDMAHRGDVRKAELLLDAGAEIDAIDEEFRSTPLGLAARFGRREMVELLLSRGANPDRGGAPWATPLEWAQKKGHADIAARLRTA